MEQIKFHKQQALKISRMTPDEVKTEEYEVSSEDLVKTVKKLIHEGNVRRIMIKDEKGKALLEIPVTVGVIGFVIAPWLAALGVIGAIVTNCTIVVEKRE